MEQYRRLLYCARFFAAAALIFYFVTSCTNYWLHAITCRTVNDTLEDESPPEFGMLRGSPKPPTESVDNTTDLRSGTVSTVSTETFNGSPKSSGKEAVLPRNVPTPRRKCKRRKGFFWNCFGGLTPLALVLHTPSLVTWIMCMGPPFSIIGSGGADSAGLNDLWKMGLRQDIRKKDYRLNYHHEGFFWRCSFSDKEEKYQLKKFIYIYQPPLKCCVHAFHSPFPNVEGRTTKEFESSISYRKLWSALMFLGVTFVTIGFLCIIYSACCENYNMYKTTGVIFLIAATLLFHLLGLCRNLDECVSGVTLYRMIPKGLVTPWLLPMDPGSRAIGLRSVSFTVSIIMYSIWISAVSQMIAGDIANCTSIITNLNFGVNYGWSFMAAPFAVLFSLISGLFFIKIAGMNCKESNNFI
ncbi:transmembrane protein 182-like isoform X2 [Hypanus sabinus]|uniref:transmembrane protein 182-like isoform X2 n=1 Tax=Hypanus sabinus TaxID=79690 RepID=UPI0028C37E42|nr:transmembrane protein 182-like isoform X2 [Hypanus sabinus]